MTSDNLPGRLAGGWGEPGPECLSDEELSLLRSDTDLESAGKRLDHVVRCDWCGRRLKAFLALADAEPDVVVMQPRRTLLRSLPRWAQAAAAVAVIVAGTMAWRLYSDPARRSERLLAEALESERTSDWRLGDGAWVASDIRRSGEGARPPALYEAEAILGREAASHSNEPRWLALRARASLLELRFADAIDLLRKAVALDSRSPVLLADLCVAYGLEASRQGGSENYAAAVEYCTRALQIDPHYPRALFNRALAFERLNMSARAIEEWEQYLKFERDPSWAAEGRRHLSELQQSERRRGELRRTDQGSDAVLESKGVEWLAADRSLAAAAGESLKRNYGDRWLADAARERVDSRPLAESHAANERGEADVALVLGAKAEAQYARQTAPAHAARARLEVLNALNRSMRAADCERRSSSLEEEARRSAYWWIEIQAEIQRAGCAAMRGDLGASDAISVAALQSAHARRMGGLELRASGILATFRTASGNIWAAWQETPDILRRWQASPYSPVRAQQAIMTYALSAELWGWRAASFEFTKAAADCLRSTPNRMMEGADRARAGALAESAGLPASAAEEASAAAGIFASLPDSTTRARSLVSIGIVQAQAELDLGRLNEAVERLRPLAEAAVQQDEKWRARQFLGLGLARLGSKSEALRELRAAVNEVERRADSLPQRYLSREAREQGMEAYRCMAAELVEEAAPDEALRIWLQAHGAVSAPDWVFLALNCGYAVWTDHGARFQRLSADRLQIRAAIARLLGSAREPTGSLATIREEGRFLFDRLLRPLGVDTIPTAPVTVLADGELASLPFNLLVKPDGSWLADGTPVAIAASGQPPGDLRALRRVLVVGSPASEEGLTPLPESRAEAIAVAGEFPERETLLGPDATSGAIRGRLPQADVFHFSGHGFAAGGIGGLYLADGPFTSLHLRGSQLDRCRLAVLAACLTAIGQTDDADRPQNLVQSFLDAGVRTVVASRWEADSRASLALMPRFYDRLRESGSPTSALAEAAAKVRADAAFAHPFYWAGYQVYE